MLVRQFSLVALALLLPLGVALSQQPDLVDVGTHRLEVLRAGSGGPTLVFEAGLGNGLDEWDRVWASAAELSSVVIYSRSGLGRSEIGPAPHTARRAVDELHALLGRLKVAPPYVLVGHSYGGLLVRLYTSIYPSEVAGLVLCEGVHEQQVRRYAVLDSGYSAAFRASFAAALDQPGAPAAEIRETVRIQEAGAVEGMKPLPDIPIAVLTSMKVTANPQFVNSTLRGHQAWRAMHDEWFQRSSNGIHLETSRAGHQIPEQEPGLLIEAIRFVLDRVRTSAGRGGTR